eukprot:9471314-Pyramimonas_sp.AAC.5
MELQLGPRKIKYLFVLSLLSTLWPRLSSAAFDIPISNPSFELSGGWEFSGSSNLASQEQWAAPDGVAYASVTGSNAKVTQTLEGIELKAGSDYTLTASTPPPHRDIQFKKWVWFLRLLGTPTKSLSSSEQWRKHAARLHDVTVSLDAERRCGPVRQTRAAMRRLPR